MTDRAEGEPTARISLADRLAAAHERWADQTPQWGRPEQDLSNLITAACGALVRGNAAPAAPEPAVRAATPEEADAFLAKLDSAADAWQGKQEGAAAQAPQPCTGSGWLAVDRQGDYYTSTTAGDGECGICHQRVRIDSYGRCVTHPPASPPDLKGAALAAPDAGAALSEEKRLAINVLGGVGHPRFHIAVDLIEQYRTHLLDCAAQQWNRSRDELSEQTKARFEAERRLASYEAASDPPPAAAPAPPPVLSGDLVGLIRRARPYVALVGGSFQLLERVATIALLADIDAALASLDRAQEGTSVDPNRGET